MLLKSKSQGNSSLLVCVPSHFSCIRLFATLWTAACQAPLSVGFSRQEYWSGLPGPPPGVLPDSGIEPTSPALTGGFFTTEPLRTKLPAMAATAGRQWRWGYGCWDLKSKQGVPGPGDSPFPHPPPTPGTDPGPGAMLAQHPLSRASDAPAVLRLPRCTVPPL